MIPFNIHLGRISFPRTVEIAVPFLPGGALLIGIVLGRPDLPMKLEGLSVLGYWTKVALAAFAAYSSGIILLFLSFVVSGVIALSILSFSSGIRIADTDLLWRKMAAEFLGDLAPREAKNEHAETEWRGWYIALRQYFHRESETSREKEWVSYLYICMLQSMGWAIAFVLLFAPVFRHPLVYTLCGFSIVAGVIILTIGMHQYFDPTEDIPELIALFLKRVRSRQEKNS